MIPFSLLSDPWQRGRDGWIGRPLQNGKCKLQGTAGQVNKKQQILFGTLLAICVCLPRVFNALCEHQHLRGLVVQQGGAKALIPLALDGTVKGKYQASQALARIGITINPEVAFPGQRMCEIVRPLLALLNMDCSGLENFEALMALCNLAGFEAPRKRYIGLSVCVLLDLSFSFID